MKALKGNLAKIILSDENCRVVMKFLLQVENLLQ